MQCQDHFRDICVMVLKSRLFSATVLLVIPVFFSVFLSHDALKVCFFFSLKKNYVLLHCNSSVRECYIRNILSSDYDVA